jgi:hypothetical protein
MAVLLIETVTCIATEDLIGEDDLRGVLGLSRFSIGRFKDGDSRRVDIEQPIPDGVSTLQIFEKDSPDADDLRHDRFNTR